MSKTRKAAALMLLVLCLGWLAGCSGGLNVQERKLTVDVIVKNAEYDFWRVVQMGAEAAGREFDVTVNYMGPKDEQAIDTQIKMVDAAIDARADAIVLAAGDYTRLVDAVDRAVAAKIPVVIIDSDVKSDRTRGFIGTDNKDAGRKLGEALVQKVGENCKIAVMGFIKGAATSDQREAGLLEVVAEHPGIEVLATVYCNSDETYAQILTNKITGEHPDVDAIVCLNAYGTVGTARGIRDLNLAGSVKIIGFDSTPEEVSFLEKGVIQKLVIQNPYSMGYQGIKYALDEIHGKSMPKNVNTGSTVIDKDNMYLPENQKLVFPFTGSEGR